MDQEKLIVRNIMSMLEEMDEPVSNEVALAALFKAFVIIQGNVIKKETVDCEDPGISPDRFYVGLKMKFINHMDQAYNRQKLEGRFRK